MIVQTPGLENKSLLPFDTYSNAAVTKGNLLYSENKFESIFSGIMGKENDIGVKGDYTDSNPGRLEVDDRLNEEFNTGINGERRPESEKVVNDPGEKKAQILTGDKSDIAEKADLKEVKEEVKSVLRKLFKHDGKDKLTKLEVKSLLERLEKLVKSLLKKLMLQAKDRNSSKKGKTNSRIDGRTGVNLETLLKKFLNILEGLKNGKETDKNELLGSLDSLIDSLDKKELAWFMKEIKDFERKDNHGRTTNDSSIAKNLAGGVLTIEEEKSSLKENKEKKNPLNKLKVTDLRGKNAKTRHVRNGKNVDSHNAALNKSSSSKISSSDAKTGVELKGENFTGMVKTASNLSSENTQAKVSRSFSRIITRVKELLSARGFKQGNIIVRNGGDGEIRLILKPKSLGNVRIKLNILDNRIEGKIFVENSSVKAILNNNMASLRDALREGGFQSAFLEVSVSGESGDNSGERENFKSGVGQSRKMVEKIDSIIPRLVEIERDDLVVNMVV